MPWIITIDIKLLGQVRQNQNWRCCEALLQFLKTDLVILSPFEYFAPLKLLCHWLGYLKEILDKPVVVAN
jgi:hypothetical protein